MSTAYPLTPTNSAATPSNPHQQWLRQYGDFSLAYATLTEPELQRFSNGHGYLAYRKQWRYTFALGDPVAPQSTWQAMIDNFLQQHPGSVFVQISAAAAECLIKHRYWINEIGIDTHLDLGNYDFRGKRREALRYAANWLQNHGYRIEERVVDRHLGQQMQQLIDAWHATRVNKREVGFLNRRAVLQDEADVRKVLLWNPAGQLEAFVFFDPLYRDGQIIGYVTAIKRRHPQSTPYAELGICKWAIARFQEEGKQLLRLGLSPLVGIENKRFRHVRPMHYSLRYFLNAGWVNRYVYNLQGHASFKRRFGGHEEPTHYASPVFFNDFRIITLLRMMKLI